MIKCLSLHNVAFLKHKMDYLFSSEEKCIKTVSPVQRLTDSVQRITVFLHKFNKSLFLKTQQGRI